MEKPKSAIQGHLATLKQKQFVIQEGDFSLPELPDSRIEQIIDRW